MFNKNIPDNLSGQEIKEMIKNNKINFKDLDTSALKKLFDYETELIGTGEWDIELLNYCAARLDELEGPVMSEEEFLSVINKTKERIFGKSRTETVSEPVFTSKRKYVLKKVWITAAVTVLLVAAATVTVSAFDLNIFQCFKEVIGVSVGEKINKDTITLINRGEAKEYGTIEELLESENLNILYPSVLPERIKIETINVKDDVNGGSFIQLLTSDAVTNCVVYTNSTSTDNSFKGCEKHEYNGFTFYVRKELNSAYCYYNNCYYSIQANSYENILLIIENIKEK